MSFTVEFYTSTADPKMLDKTNNITLIGTSKTINSKHEIDILNPVFTVNYDALLLLANYCKITEFNRYYFCTIATDTAQKIIVRAVVDPLFSHMTAIKNCPVTVVRSETSGVNFVSDGQLPIDPNRINIYGDDFPNNPFNKLTTTDYLIITNS